MEGKRSKATLALASSNAPRPLLPAEQPKENLTDVQMAAYERESLTKSRQLSLSCTKIKG